MSDKLGQPLTLPCGATIRNRLAKAAMTEGIASPTNTATEAHRRLYGLWAQGGAGLLLTGNVQVDRRFLERPGNVAIDRNGGLDALRAYAEAGRAGDTHIWMQINHPGRQAGTATEQFVSPSVNTIPGKEGLTRALAADEIEDIVARFVHVAQVAQDCGFTGVQVHAAHGYLASQFLSPLTNRRDDAWGGSLENRARFLVEIVRRTRAAVGRAFPVSVKLNSADFQKGGLTEDDSIEVIRWLEAEGLDLLEISGGNYESQSMVGRDEDFSQLKQKAASTIAREAYFLQFADRLQPLVRVPLMVTGGFRTRSAMEQALQAGEFDVVGLARPLCIDPAVCNGLLDGSIERLPSPDDAVALTAQEVGTDDPLMLRAAEVQAAIAYYFNQVRRLSTGEPAPDPIDWFRELQEHQAFDAAADVRYKSAFEAVAG